MEHATAIYLFILPKGVNKIMPLLEAIVHRRKSEGRPFRILSYIFKLHEWDPTLVDRTSKGDLPIYVYEFGSWDIVCIYAFPSQQPWKGIHLKLGYISFAWVITRRMSLVNINKTLHTVRRTLALSKVNSTIAFLTVKSWYYSYGTIPKRRCYNNIVSMVWYRTLKYCT